MPQIRSVVNTSSRYLHILFYNVKYISNTPLCVLLKLLFVLKNAVANKWLNETSTALNVSGDQDKMSPRDRSPARTSSPRQPSGKDHWNQWSPYNLTLLQLETNYWFIWPEGKCPPRLSLVSPKVFFSILFLAVVASGLLSWGHFISSDITDLIAQILFKLNWAGWWHHWIQ